MQEYELEILEKYPVNVKGTRKTRGAFFCDTEEGLFLLCEAKMSEEKARQIVRVMEHLKEEGVERIDEIIPSIDGNYVCQSEEGKHYILKKWFYGREGDMRKSGELIDMTKHLTRLHRHMHLEWEAGEQIKPRLDEIYRKRNRELKKVRAFIRSQPRKNGFEQLFLMQFRELYEWTDMAMQELQCCAYDALYEKSRAEHCLVHGEYNYHHVLFTLEGIATTCFDKCQPNMQVEDLYYFLRKAMEKHDWNVWVGDHILNAYSSVIPITKQEMKFLEVRLLYPEKFWKIADSYMQSNKARIPMKHMDKLQMLTGQLEKKRVWMREVFGCFS